MRRRSQRTRRQTWFPLLTSLTIGGKPRLDPAEKSRCAADKQHERMPYGRSTIERTVVKRPPYPDLATSWGVQHGGEGLSSAHHSRRLKTKLGWIWLELNCPKVNSERCLLKY